MSTVDDEPSNPGLISELDWTDNVDIRKDSLYAVSGEVIATFIDLDTNLNIDNGESQMIRSSITLNFLLSTGMLYMEYCDVIWEGDGFRVLRCWRYMLLLFKSTGRTNYSIESFNVLAQYNFILSKRQASQIWGRFVNVHGLPCHNIQCDLYMEHLNRVFKTAVTGLGANRKDNALLRAGKVVGTLDKSLMDLTRLIELVGHLGVTKQL